MHVACCQLDIAWEDKPANYRQVEALLTSAEVAPGTLVLLPEMFATGFTMNSEAVAEPIDGPTSRFLAELAQQHGMFVQAGVVIRTDKRDASAERSPPLRSRRPVAGPLRRRNPLVFLRRRARHYPAGRGDRALQSGRDRRRGSICYDLRFPELFRTAVAQGFEVMSTIACWPAAREEHWSTAACPGD